MSLERWFLNAYQIWVWVDFLKRRCRKKNKLCFLHWGVKTGSTCITQWVTFEFVADFFESSLLFYWSQQHTMYSTRLRDASFGNQNSDVINPFSISTLLFLKCPEGIVYSDALRYIFFGTRYVPLHLPDFGTRSVPFQRNISGTCSVTVPLLRSSQVKFVSTRFLTLVKLILQTKPRQHWWWILSL